MEDDFFGIHNVSEIKEMTDYAEVSRLIEHNEWVLLSVVPEQNYVLPVVPLGEGKLNLIGSFKYCIGKMPFKYTPPKKF